PFHAPSVGALNVSWSSGGRPLTTSHVLAELAALLTSPFRVSKSQQIQLLRAIRADPVIEVVPADPTLDAAAWLLCESRPDKDWTLADCASFVIMQQRGLTDALTTDHHFEQAGFVRLLK